MMDVGFDTIGNAILICYDSAPILVTDPWLVGTAYFGSWTFSHDIPESQMVAIRQCQFAWLSHGHPDHLSVESLRLLRAKKLLLPDHVGSRIATDLSNEGFSVQVLADRIWYQLSPRIRVFCIADYNQDGILLIDINGRLIINMNDASDRGWGALVNSIIRRYTRSFLLRLSGFGDTDMINIFHETGGRLTPRAAKKRPVGQEIAMMLRQFPARYFIPFSSMHRYQRKDSAWAEQYTTRLPDYAIGFESSRSQLLPAFLRWNCERDTYEQISPSERAVRFVPPEDYGDNWSDPLEKSEFPKIADYFKSIKHLSDHFDYLNFRVGKRDNIVELSRRKFNRAITFEVPRNSLVTAIRYRIFDDLLIGNFMRTTLHGRFGKTGLYPDFTPYVAKYADNGGARSREELREYFEQYRQRAPISFLKGLVEAHARDVIRYTFDIDSRIYGVARRTYFALK
jgi:hypothetical protein